MTRDGRNQVALMDIIHPIEIQTLLEHKFAAMLNVPWLCPRSCVICIILDNTMLIGSLARALHEGRRLEATLPTSIELRAG
jgi:hypothetical protein